MVYILNGLYTIGLLFYLKDEKQIVRTKRRKIDKFCGILITLLFWFSLRRIIKIKQNYIPNDLLYSVNHFTLQTKNNLLQLKLHVLWYFSNLFLLLFLQPSWNYKSKKKSIFFSAVNGLSTF